jgi:hypothetical protein
MNGGTKSLERLQCARRDSAGPAERRRRRRRRRLRAKVWIPSVRLKQVTGFSNKNYHQMETKATIPPQSYILVEMPR